MFIVERIKKKKNRIPVDVRAQRCYKNIIVVLFVPGSLLALAQRIIPLCWPVFVHYGARDSASDRDARGNSLIIFAVFSLVAVFRNVIWREAVALCQCVL